MHADCSFAVKNCPYTPIIDIVNLMQINPTIDARAARALTWAPLMLLAALLSWHLAGAQLVPTSSAASQTVIIDGAVDKDVQLDVSGCAAGTDLAFGSFPSNSAWKATTTPCTVVFGSNNSSAGADLQVREDPIAGAGAAFKCVGGGCGADTIADTPVATRPAAPASAFGLTLEAVSGSAVNVWSMAGSAAYPAADIATTACQTASAAAGTCDFKFGVMASGDLPGTYQGQVQYIVLAR